MTAAAFAYPQSIKDLLSYLKTHPTVERINRHSEQPETLNYIRKNGPRLEFMNPHHERVFVPLVCNEGGNETGVMFEEDGFVVEKYGVAIKYSYGGDVAN